MRTPLLLLVLVGALACDHFENPTSQECQAGLSNLVRFAVTDDLNKDFPTDKDNLFGKLAKDLGAGIVTEFMLDDQKVAWCEVNMSKHQANCLRVGLTKEEVDSCGIAIDAQGKLSK